MPEQPVIYYAVTRERGKRWDARRSMREQEQWDAHARFMDALAEEGFIVLGGPLDNGSYTLLIINAESRQAIEARFAGDPWTAMELLRIAKIERWEILLDARQ
jgi:uncharacterized protein YciI